MQSDCTYSLEFTIKEKKKKGKPKPVYDVGASFSGNNTLTSCRGDRGVRPMTALYPKNRPQGRQMNLRGTLSVLAALAATAIVAAAPGTAAAAPDPPGCTNEHPVRPDSPDVQGLRRRERDPEQHAGRLLNRHHEQAHHLPAIRLLRRRHGGHCGQPPGARHQARSRQHVPRPAVPLLRGRNP